jgi:hypothetical protein
VRLVFGGEFVTGWCGVLPGACVRHNLLHVKNYFYFDWRKRKEMSARAGAKECCQGVGMAFPLSTYHSWKGRGEVLEKDLGSTRNSKELIVEWEQPRLR